MLRLDNTNDVAYIQWQGGTRIKTLLKEVGPILGWAECNLKALSATYVPGVQHVRADYLSRNRLDNNEWSFHQHVFKYLTGLTFLPEVDLFASGGQCKAEPILCQGPLPSGGGSGCTVCRLEVSDGMCLSPCAIDWALHPQSFQGTEGDPRHHSRLAVSPMVSDASEPELSAAIAATDTNRPALTGSGLSSSPGEITSHGLDIERRCFLKVGCSSKVIDILLKSRKPSTNTTYNRVWQKFTEYAKEHSFSDSNPGVQHVLDYKRDRNWASV